MKYARVRITAPQLETPLATLAGTDGVETVDLLATGVTGDGTESYSASVDGPERAVRDALADDGNAVTWDVAAEDGIVHAYVQCRPSPELQRLRERFTADSLVVLLPVRFHADGVELTVLGTRSDLSNAFDALPSRFGVSTLEVGIYRNGIGRGRTLTERQREVLETAYELGYYERPSETTHEGIADALGCAPSTVGEHLREAEHRLVTEVFESTAAIDR